MRYYPTRLDHPWMLCVFSNDFFLSLSLPLNQSKCNAFAAASIKFVWCKGSAARIFLWKCTRLASRLGVAIWVRTSVACRCRRFTTSTCSRSIVQIKSFKEAKKGLSGQFVNFISISLTYFIITGNKTAISSIYISVRYEKDVMQHSGKKSHFICSKNPSRASIDPRPIVVSCETTS